MITCAFEDGGKATLRHLVVHAITEKENKILLVKRANFLDEAGKWAFPGGFLERNETAKEAVLRELLEETGWQGNVLDLFRINSNPNRPKEDRQNVALEFIINPLRQIKTSYKESSEIKWWSIDEMSKVDFAFDHGETINLYLQYRQKPFTIPLIV